MSDTKKFARDFNVLSGAAVGVVVVHTREPLRTQQTLHELAFEKSKPFRVWDVVHGWRVYSDLPTEKPTKEPIYDAYSALRRITDMENEGRNAWTDGLFVMHYPHWVLPKHPGFIQCLKHYVGMFAETSQRLVLLAPEGFTLPAELQNDLMTMDFPLPSADEIEECLEGVFADSTESTVGYTAEQKGTLVRNAAGMTRMEAETAFAKAVVANSATWPETDFETFNKVLLEAKTEVIKRSEVLEMMDTQDFSQVGGLDLLKEYVSQRKDAFTDEARDFGVDCPKGIMLLGPPGTGKSLCAKAISGVLGLPLIKFDVGRVFGSLVGQSEERVRSALKQLEAAAPVVCLLDEVDKGLGGAHQAGGDSGVSKRVLGNILTHMQESTKPIYWVFSANRTDGLPPELLRKGRLDEVFCVTVPNSREREEILTIHLRKRKQSITKIAGMDKVIAASKGYVGSEIEAAVAEAVNMAYHDGKRKVTSDDMIEQLKIMKPISVAFKEDFDRMAEWAANNARAASSEGRGGAYSLEAGGEGRREVGQAPARPRRRIAHGGQQ